MSGEPRSLPSRPSLRYLRLEAKRRLSTAEFGTLHEAQVAIAREYGLPSWAVLKQRIQADTDSHALAQLHWVIDRFRAADQPGWIAPDGDEMRAHFDDRFLAVISPSDLAAVIAAVAADLRGELTVIRRALLDAEVQLTGIRYVAAVDEAPPHRLLGLQGFPVGERITGRTAPSAEQSAKQPAHQPATLPARTQGPVPGQLADLADETVAELGLPALVLAGGEPGLDPGQVGGRRGDLGKTLVRHEGTGFAVGQDVGDLRGHLVPVDRHHVQAGLDRGEVESEGGHAVGQQGRHRIARGQPEGLQAPAVAVRLAGQLGVAHHPAVRLDDRGPVRRARGDGPQADGVHGNNVERVLPNEQANGADRLTSVAVN